VEDLLALTEVALSELAQTVRMKPGHLTRLKRLLEEYAILSQDKETKHKTSDCKERGDIPLPPGKQYHFFASHKKLHSKNGTASESLALRTKDWLQSKVNLNIFFDLDDLSTISMEALTAAIKASAAVVLFLDSETHLST
jgi:hypothetical protein